MGATTTLVTVREFLEMPETEGLLEELIGGEVISMPRSGYPHEVTKSNIIRVLTAWSLGNPSLRLFCEAAYQLDDRNCLIPDLSLLASNRILPGSTGVFQGAPEIAIEVVSSESAARLEDKNRTLSVARKQICLGGLSQQAGGARFRCKRRREEV